MTDFYKSIYLEPFSPWLLLSCFPKSNKRIPGGDLTMQMLALKLQLCWNGPAYCVVNSILSSPTAIKLPVPNIVGGSAWRFVSHWYRKGFNWLFAISHLFLIIISFMSVCLCSMSRTPANLCFPPLISICSPADCISSPESAVFHVISKVFAGWVA